MTDESRKLRREFIHRLRGLMHRKGVTQIVLACHLRIGDKHLAACLDTDRDNCFPTHLLARAVELLGTEVFDCIPGVDLVITKRPIGNVAAVTGAAVAVLKEAGELAAVVLEVGADGTVTTDEQARVDTEAAEVQRAASTAAETTRAATITRIRS